MISQYKEKARMSLKGNWGNAIIVFLGIYFLGGMISSVPQYFVMPGIMSQMSALENLTEPDFGEIMSIAVGAFGIVLILQTLITVFVVSVLQLGYQSFSIKLARTDKADPDVIFNGFKNHYWTNVKALLWVGLYTFLWMIPSFALFGVGIYMSVTEMSMFPIFFILGFIAQLLAMIKVLKYSLVGFLLMDENVHFDTGKEYLKESVRIMTGNVFELILLGLSFILWIFFIVITLGFGTLYVGPYMQQAYANFYLQNKEEKNIAYQ